MNIETTRFGSLAVDPAERVYFPEGLLGFSAYPEYVLIPGSSGTPSHMVSPEDQVPGRSSSAPRPVVLWLQSCQVPELAFTLCPAEILVSDYGAAILADRVRAEDLQAIELASLDEASVYVIVHRGRTGLVANLRGPVIINERERLGKQLVLNDARVPLRYTIERPAPAEPAVSAPAGAASPPKGKGKTVRQAG